MYVDLALSKSTPHSEMASWLQEAMEVKGGAVWARLSDFRREALHATNAAAALAHQGTDIADVAEARRLVTGLTEAARRECFEAVASACNTIRVMPRGGWRSFSRCVTALAAISVAARAAVEHVIGAVDGEVPADLAIIHLAQLVGQPAHGTAFETAPDLV